MAAAGLYTIGGSFWEFGEPDWERTRYFMMFGVAEDHDSNPIKIGLGKLKARGAKFVSVNPVRTGYSAIADEWIGIRPGTDGLFVLALIHELLRAGKVDLDYLVRYTNAPWLVIRRPGRAPTTACSRATRRRAAGLGPRRRRRRERPRAGCRPALKGEVTLAGRARARGRCFSCSPSATSTATTRPERRREQTGIAAGDHPPDRRRARARGVRGGDRARHALDRCAGAGGTSR